jgi:DNA polymerase-3 subunit delta'
MTRLDAILGHERPKRILRQALASGRLAHAWLFAGEPQVGKFSLAQAFAALALCNAPAADEACGTCASCRLTAAGTHPDLITLAPDGAQIKIEQILELQRKLALRPYSAARKVAVVDEADALNPQAANAFLKTLEEPPAASLLVLVSARPSALLDTIRSRCQPLWFGAPPLADVTRLVAERRGLAPDAARFLAAISLGRIGRALAADVAALRERRDQTLALLAPETLASPGLLLAAAQETAADEARYDETLDQLIILIRDLLLVRAGAPDDSLIHLDLRPRLSALAPQLPSAALLAAVDRIEAVQAGANRNLNRTLMLESVLLGLRDGLAEAKA